MCHLILAHYFFTMIISVLSQMIFRPDYSFSISPPPPPNLLVICFFNFSTHTLRSSLSLPFLLLLQSNFSDLFSCYHRLSCWHLGFLSQFTFLLLHFQLYFLGFLKWITAAPCYLITTKENGARHRRWVIFLLTLISRPGSDIAGISCEAVDEL